MGETVGEISSERSSYAGSLLHGASDKVTRCAVEPPAPLGIARVTRALRWFAWVTTVCAATGTLLYCYSATLAPLRAGLAWSHEITGWVATMLLGAYLSAHLRRTWRLREGRPMSWWTGVAGALAWLVSFAAGVWMELAPIARNASVWWWHGVASFAVVVILCFHAAYGFRSLTKKGAVHE